MYRYNERARDKEKREEFVLAKVHFVWNAIH